MLIAGDIGGTKTNLGLYQSQDHKYLSLHFATFPSQDYENLETIVREFIKQCASQVNISEIKAAAFAVAGPVIRGVCKATNLPWIVETTSLSKLLNIENVYLLNDLQANAYALEILPAESLFTLYEPKEKQEGNQAVISPGTGLGEAGLFYDGTRHHPFACEGGHVEFGPRNDLQIQLCQYLIKRFGHASYERILSGPGIHNIYLFLRDVMRQREPDWLAAELLKKNPSSVISTHAIRGDVEICINTMDLFVSIFGSEAGNCVLKFMAVGGLFIGGGIAPKILPKLQETTFMQGFLDKGRFRSLLEKVPIKVMLNDQASLLGSCHYCRLKVAGLVAF